MRRSLTIVKLFFNLIGMILKINKLIQKILRSDFLLFLYSLFYEKSLYKSSLKIARKKTNSQNAWDDLVIDISEMLRRIHPRFFLATSVARRAFSPVGHKKMPVNREYIMKDINIYSFYALFLSKAFCFLDYPSAFAWCTSWGSIFNKAFNSYHIKENPPTTIIEFGSGLGIFPLILSYCFPKSDLILYDLPIMLEMQKRTHNYLASYSLPINRSKFQYIDNLSELESSLYQSNNSKNNYFIAYWSFSETPLDLREKFVPIFKNCLTIMIVSNPQIFGIDNNLYFNKLAEELNATHKYSQLLLPFQEEYISNNGQMTNHRIHLFKKK